MRIYWHLQIRTSDLSAWWLEDILEVLWFAVKWYRDKKLEILCVELFNFLVAFIFVCRSTFILTKS